VELLKELIPKLAQVAAILNPDNPAAESEFHTMEASARSLNVKRQPLSFPLSNA
jgi:ABC-type uncharacterized transport system substrate-binding protein